MSELKTWNDLSDATLNWSMANFGSSSGLGLLCPLMGIGEEIGEYMDATTTADMRDAIGDIGIYLANYCALAVVDMDGAPHIPPEYSLDSAYYKLLHIRLKRIQKIRGMENTGAFLDAEDKAIGRILSELNVAAATLFSKPVAEPALEIALETWHNVVSKRQWRSEPLHPITEESCIEDYKALAYELNWGSIDKCRYGV